VIKKLKREGGGVVEGKELGIFITNHYKSLFTSSAGEVDNDLLQHVPQNVAAEMNESLWFGCYRRSQSSRPGWYACHLL
jgi:hypothetical protein